MLPLCSKNRSKLLKIFPENNVAERKLVTLTRSVFTVSNNFSLICHLTVIKQFTRLAWWRKKKLKYPSGLMFSVCTHKQTLSGLRICVRDKKFACL